MHQIKLDADMEALVKMDFQPIAGGKISPNDPNFQEHIEWTYLNIYHEEMNTKSKLQLI